MSQCGPAYRVVTYVVTILRCIPAGDENGPPTCAQLDAAAQIQLDDAAAVWNGVICCFDEDEHEFTVLGQTMVGPAGFCGGSALTIAVGFTGVGSSVHEVMASDSGSGSGG
jgi:hypothetical protein